MSTDESDPVTDRHGLDVLGLEECLTLLRSQPVGRLAYIDAGEPAVVPVNHLMDGSTVILRSLSGGKLDAAVVGEPVAFQIDAFNLEARTGWSVLVRGSAQLIDDADDIAAYETELDSWSITTPSTATWIRIVATEVSGRRIHST